jgi:hypothetical protein
MSPTIEELVPVSEALNAESNDLNQTINTISNKLAALNLGIEIWFATESPDVEVGFAKVYDPQHPAKESWQLAARHGAGQTSQLVGASRDIRIEGLRRVPGLVQNLKSEAESRIRAMKEAKQLAAEL